MNCQLTQRACEDAVLMTSVVVLVRVRACSPCSVILRAAEVFSVAYRWLCFLAVRTKPPAEPGTQPVYARQGCTSTREHHAHSPTIGFLSALLCCSLPVCSSLSCNCTKAVGWLVGWLRGEQAPTLACPTRRLLRVDSLARRWQGWRGQCTYFFFCTYLF
jgi:hypothetical protein